MIEAGWTISLCYAPWRGLKSKRTNQHHGNYDDVGVWPVRFLLFKLMLMSGVVKLQADCPTWNNLTALEYHFATQCLPGPLAWYAHQMHPFLLRLSVAVTLIIEIPAAFFLICPNFEFQWVGACLQLCLQVLIILSGNYNFFNGLTIVLCLPLLYKDIGTKTGSMGTRRISKEKEVTKNRSMKVRRSFQSKFMSLCVF